LDGYTASHIVLMIGTNNLGTCSDSEIIAGLRRVIAAIQVRQPRASILVSGIFPRRKMEERIVKLNKEIAVLATSADRTPAGGNVQFINPGKILLNSQGKIDEQLFSDGLHPSAAGYWKLAPLLSSYLKD
jgi:lysophospholipase L1-like esterase